MTLGFSTQMFGKPNHFVEKILSSLYSDTKIKEEVTDGYYYQYSQKFRQYGLDYTEFKPKVHTIRVGNRWKKHHNIHFVVGNRTKNRFQFAPLLRVTRIQDIEIKWKDHIFRGEKQKGGICNIFIDNKKIHPNKFGYLLQNDGFESLREFFEYFKTDFKGQLIHWTEGITYF